MATTLHPRPFIHVERSLPQKICMTMGWVLVILGVLGFMAPGFLGMHLSVAHSTLQLFFGVLSLIFGLSEKSGPAYTFSWIFGAFYVLLGIAGFFFGSMGFPTVGNLLHEERFLWSIAPNVLEFAANDHIIHILIGAIFWVPALWWRAQQIPKQP